MNAQTGGFIQIQRFRRCQKCCNSHIAFSAYRQSRIRLNINLTDSGITIDNGRVA